MQAQAPQPAHPALPTQPAQPALPTQPAQPAHPGRHSARRHPPTEASPHQAPPRQASPAEASPLYRGQRYEAQEYQALQQRAQAYQEPEPGEVIRYGPGVPVKPGGQPSQTAEALWRAGRLPPSRRRVRLRRLLGTALTVILLAASGAILYLRFHHAPFQVSGVSVSQQSATACGLDVTGLIVTNGAAGTISYQWVFRPGHRTPQPLSQSVIAGQRDVYVTVSVQGQGQGSAFQTVTLQVLGPNTQSASMGVIIRCR